VKSALVIRHIHFEDLGAFTPVLESHGYVITYLDPGLAALPAPAADDADLLIVLGGPIGAYEDELYPFLREELKLLEHRLANRRPVLGICLGAQLIARALGARVYPGPGKEIGWSTLQLTKAGRARLPSLEGIPVLHWHGDTFDLPAGADLLASTALCTRQAFAIDDHVLAFQFHPEVWAYGFERWLVGHACEIAATPGVTVPDLRRQAGAFAEAGGRAGQTCLDAWLAGFEPTQ
jgi:GMP synthase (glutamine-hydrolysing)